MLVTAIWMLFIAQSFAKNLVPHAHEQIFKENVENDTPAEYFDSKRLPNPHYKINYIYEQRRTDEDPEVDQIEEEIGKYMHYQQSTITTTTATEPQGNGNVNENFKEEETNHENHQHKEVTSTLAPIPPAPELREPINEVLFAPITQWEELKEVPNNIVAASHSDRTHFLAHEQTPTPHRHPNRRLHISPTTSATPIEKEASTTEAYVSTEKHIYLSPTTHIPVFKNRRDHKLLKVRPTLDNIKQGSHGLAPRPVYRGSYKFSWDDINDMHTSTEPKLSQLKENPIPSVPTLSPWYDGYGK